MPRGKNLKMTVLGPFENWIGLKVISGWGERFWGSRFWLIFCDRKLNRFESHFRVRWTILRVPFLVDFWWSKTGPVWKSFQGEVNDFEGPVFGWFWWSPKLDRFESHFRVRWTILRVPFLVHLRISKTGSVWKSFQGEVNDLEGPVLEIFNVYSCVHNSSLWGPPMPCGCNLVLISDGLPALASQSQIIIIIPIIIKYVFVHWETQPFWHNNKELPLCETDSFETMRFRTFKAFKFGLHFTMNKI